MYRHNARLSGVLLIHGLICAADFEPEEEGKPDTEDAVQQLISILDPDTSTLEARQLLFRANGDIALALNLHYDDASNSGEMLPAECIAKLYNDLLSCMFCPGAPERSLSCSLRMYDLIICTRVCQGNKERFMWPTLKLC